MLGKGLSMRVALGFLEDMFNSLCQSLSLTLSVHGLHKDDRKS